MDDVYRYPLRLRSDVAAKVAELARLHQQSINAELGRAAEQWVALNRDMSEHLGRLAYPRTEQLAQLGMQLADPGIQSALRVLSDPANQASFRAAERLAQQFETMFANQQPHLGDIIDQGNYCIAQLNDEYHPILSQIAAQLQPNLDSVKRAFEELFQYVPAGDELREVMLYLAGKGWFISDVTSFTIVHNLLSLMRNGEDEAIEQFMLDHSRSCLDSIEDEVKQDWPHRAGLLAEAFWAHRAERYTLSIPVMLAQADGICQDILGVQLYAKTRDDRKPRTRKVLITKLNDSVVDISVSFIGALISPLLDGASLSVDTRERDARRLAEPEYGPLNRHGVLHGIDVDYPSEANSLRVIMLLGYLSLVSDTLERRRSVPSGAGV